MLMWGTAMTGHPVCKSLTVPVALNILALVVQAHVVKPLWVNKDYSRSHSPGSYSSMPECSQVAAASTTGVCIVTTNNLCNMLYMSHFFVDRWQGAGSVPNTHFQKARLLAKYYTTDDQKHMVSVLGTMLLTYVLPRNIGESLVRKFPFF